MSLPENVMKDLLAVVVAGEASPETRRLVEEYARDHPEFARTAERAGDLRLSRPAPPAPDREMEALRRTKSLLRWRSMLLGLALTLSLLSLRFRFDALHVTWGWQGDPAPRLVLMVLAAAAWAGYLVVVRRLTTTSL